MKAEYPIISFPAKGTITYPYRRHPLVKPGTHEQQFACELSAKLPAGVECILNACIITTDKQPPYYPDLALVVADRPEVRIDVEIDEPYQKSTREPIHYVSCGDMFRDNLLNRHGWTVVRLAAQQIVQEPSICADFLVELVSAMMADIDTASQHVFTSVPFPVARWSRNDALKMAYWQKIAGEDKQWITDRYALDADELKCKQLVKPFDKTADMLEKMTTFRDAGRYAQDADIDFEPDEHIYIYKGIKRMLSVSALISYFFDEFQALSQAENQWRYKGTPVEESLDKWAKAGRLASEVGTFVHLQTENYFQRGFFETECKLQFGSETEVVSVEQEKLHFLHFIRDYQIEPYRQEWPVYDKDLNIAGTIDLICQNDDLRLEALVKGCQRPRPAHSRGFQRQDEPQRHQPARYFVLPLLHPAEYVSLYARAPLRHPHQGNESGSPEPRLSHLLRSPGAQDGPAHPANRHHLPTARLRPHVAVKTLHIPLYEISVT